MMKKWLSRPLNKGELIKLSTAKIRENAHSKGRSCAAACALARAGALTSVGAGLELAAWRWAPLVDGAGAAHAHLAGQSRAARPGVVGAAHACNARGDVYRQTLRHAAAQLLGFVHREINAEGGAAGAAAQAGIGFGGGA